MKKTQLWVFLCMICNVVSAQVNYVPNPSFETYITCPTNSGQVKNYCADWFSYYRSPDYNNICSQTAGVPNNFAGYQYPVHGQAYTGLCAYHTASNFEYLGVPITRLTPGVEYRVSMSVNLANSSGYATNNLGILFWDNYLGQPNAANIITRIPQVHYSYYGVVTDTLNWTRLTNTFVADSSYDSLMIGGFNDPTNTYIIDTLNPLNTYGYAYYFIDSVVVQLARRFGIIYSDNMICAGNTIKVPYYADNSLGYFQSNNIFTLQLSNSSGSFANPVNIGTRASNVSDTITGIIPANTPFGTGYRLRMVSSNLKDTTIDNRNDIAIGNVIPAKPVAGNNGPVCHNDTLYLTATSTTSGVGYRWKGPNNFSSALQNPRLPNPYPVNGGPYIVTAYLTGCESKDTTTVVVPAGAGVSGTHASYNTPLCENDTLKISGVANGSVSYSWTGPNNFTSSQQNPVFPNASPSLSGTYVLFAYDGVCLGRDTLQVVVKPKPVNFSATTNLPLCAGQTLQFTGASSSAGVTYAWTGPNGFSSNIASPFIGSATTVHNGSYTVIATLNGCRRYDTLAVSIKPLPTKPVAGSNTPLCAGQTLNLTTTMVGGVSYGWAGPNSFSSGLQNPSLSNVATTASGDYIITATLNGCIDKDTETVLVKAAPLPVTASTNGPVCAGDTLRVNSTASSTGVIYSWNGPGRFNSGTKNTYVANSSTAATGWYIVTVSLNGCEFKDSSYALVNAIPATPAAIHSTPLCVGETLQLTAANVAGATYAWTGPGGFSSALQNPVRANMNFTDTGTYSVSAMINGCISPAGTTKVNINPQPFVVIQAVPGDTICDGAPVVFTGFPNNHGGTPQYRWLINNQAAGTGAVYSTTTLMSGDIVSCEMTEFTKCNSDYKDSSNEIEMVVMPWLAPSVSIKATPPGPLKPGEYVMYEAAVTNGGKTPTYQWKRNGKNVLGATSYKWSANTLDDNDLITVEIGSNYRCPSPTTAVSNAIKFVLLTSVHDLAGEEIFRLYPNPNKGKFIIEITPAIAEQKLISFEVVNAMGQIVYSGNFEPLTRLKEIDPGNMTPGVYLFRLYTDAGIQAARFTIYD